MARPLIIFIIVATGSVVSSAAYAQQINAMEPLLDIVVNQIANLSAKVEDYGNEMNNLKSVFNSRLETLNSSIHMIENKTGSALANLQSSRQAIPALENSPQTIENRVDDLRNYFNPSTISVQGLIVGTSSGPFTVTLPSLKQSKLSTNFSDGVAFDWKLNKLYWIQNGNYSIRNSNLDGKDTKQFRQVITFALAVDSISGNVYFQDGPRMRVCTRSGDKCSVAATERTADHIRNIALHLTRSLMFWTDGNTTMRANMDGTDPRVISFEGAQSMSVDEASDRIYWIDKNQKYIASSDLYGNHMKVLLSDTQAGLRGITVHEDLVYYGKDSSLYSVSKYGGNRVSIVETAGRIYSIALYGSKTFFPLNPCESSPCSHLCVPKIQSFACLCPHEQHLDHDGTTCL